MRIFGLDVGGRNLGFFIRLAQSDAKVSYNAYGLPWFTCPRRLLVGFGFDGIEIEKDLQNIRNSDLIINMESSVYGLNELFSNKPYLGIKGELENLENNYFYQRQFFSEINFSKVFRIPLSQLEEFLEERRKEFYLLFNRPLGFPVYKVSKESFEEVKKELTDLIPVWDKVRCLLEEIPDESSLFLLLFNGSIFIKPYLKFEKGVVSWMESIGQLDSILSIFENFLRSEDFRGWIKLVIGNYRGIDLVRAISFSLDSKLLSVLTFSLSNLLTVILSLSQNRSIELEIVNKMWKLEEQKEEVVDKWHKIEDLEGVFLRRAARIDGKVWSYVTHNDKILFYKASSLSADFEQFKS